LQEVVEGGFPAGSPDLVLYGAAAANLGAGGAAGRFGAHAGELLVGGGGLLVGFQLFFEFAVYARLLKEGF
jgi:hypothetical protein